MHELSQMLYHCHMVYPREVYWNNIFWYLLSMIYLIPYQNVKLVSMQMIWLLCELTKLLRKSKYHSTMIWTVPMNHSRYITFKWMPRKQWSVIGTYQKRRRAEEVIMNVERLEKVDECKTSKMCQMSLGCRQQLWWWVLKYSMMAKLSRPPLKHIESFCSPMWNLFMALPIAQSCHSINAHFLSRI